MAPDELAEKTHFIKCRFRGEKRWRFLTPDCGTTWLRGRAARATRAEADSDVTQFTGANPGVKFKSVPIGR